MWHHVDGMGWWMIWGGILTLLFWGGLIAIVVWGVRSVADPGRVSEGARQRSSAIAIAEERYARGEITREQFREIRQEIQDPADLPKR